MSFKCDKCGTVQKTGVGPVMVVTHKRSYIPAPGSQIVKEIRACGLCAVTMGEPVEMEPMRNTEFLKAMAQANEPPRPSSWAPVSFSQE